MNLPRHALLPLLLLLLALALAGTGARAADTEPVQVTDAFVELHTGPGRGYPVFHVAGRSEWITIFLRRTDWYQVRTDKGIEGWVHRSQLESTLTAYGDRKSFRDIVLDDYLLRRAELGAQVGRFKGESMIKFWGAWRASDTLAVEGALAQVQGTFSGTTLWHVGLNIEPWSNRRFSPFAGIGLGKFKDIPNATLVGATPTDAKLAHATIGLRYHLGERFIARVDYTLYTAFVGDSRTSEYRALAAGVGFFF